MAKVLCAADLRKAIAALKALPKDPEDPYWQSRVNGFLLTDVHRREGKARIRRYRIDHGVNCQQARKALGMQYDEAGLNDPPSEIH